MRAEWARGERKRLCGLMLGVSALALLVACDDDKPVNAARARPGVERQVAPSNSLPAASAGRQYDIAVAPVDETRSGPRIGGIVAERGGQKAQLEAAAKEAAKRDAEIREAREARDKTERVAAAERKAPDPKQPPAQVAAAQSAVVTTATVPPPESSSAPPAAQTAVVTSATPPPEPAMAVATVPARPADPNKAFEPPPGWVPPGQASPVNVPVTTPTPAASAPVQTASAVPPPTPAVTTTVVTTTAVTPPPPAVEVAPMPAPAASARRADPNKAFEPPAGWAPPATTEPANVQTASVPVTSAPVTNMPPPAPVIEQTRTTPATAPQPRRVDANKAFEPPPGWTPPAPTAPVIQTAAAAPPVVQQAAPPPPVPMAPVVPSPVPPPPVTAVAVTTPVPVVATPPMSTKADVARAISGEVPLGVLKSQPLGSQLQIAVIQFNRSSSGLGGNDQSVLSKVAQIHKKNGGTVRIVAHAAKDVTGSSVGDIESGNYEVSKRRALAIANQLMALGVPRGAIVAEAASDGEPIYETNTARGLAANRRAEVFLDF